MDAAITTRRSYSDDQRAEALRLYVEVGPAEAGRLLSIPAATVRKWAERSDLTLKDERGRSVAAAVEGARLTWAQRRADVAQRAGDAAAIFLERALEAGPRGAADLMRAFKIALDSAQLLSGGAMNQAEVIDQQKVDDELKELLGTLHNEAIERSEQLAREGDPRAIAAALRTVDRELKDLPPGEARANLLELVTSIGERRDDRAQGGRDAGRGAASVSDRAAKAA